MLVYVCFHSLSFICCFPRHTKKNDWKYSHMTIIGILTNKTKKMLSTKKMVQLIKQKNLVYKEFIQRLQIFRHFIIFLDISMLQIMLSLLLLLYLFLLCQLFYVSICIFLYVPRLTRVIIQLFYYKLRYLSICDWLFEWFQLGLNKFLA